MNQNRKRPLLDNRGSALLSVIISMLFLLALGLSLLLVSYTSFSVAASQRSEKKNFYHAESALEEVRFGLQTLLSDAVAPAYTKALAKNPDSNQAQAVFNNLLIQELLSRKAGSEFYFTGTVIGGRQELSGYSAEALYSFVGPGARDYVTLTGKGTIRPIYGEGGVLQSVVLEGLRLVYLKSGYETQLTTDVRISMPSFNTAAATIPGMENYALIADGILRNRIFASELVTAIIFPSNCTVSGSVFANQGISLKPDLLTLFGYNLTVRDGDLISRGPISVEDTSSLTWSGGEKELWAESLRVASSSGTTSASLEGRVYLADDLVVDGSNTAITLKNSFFGFGSDRETPEKSSAILVNGSNLSNVSLDFSGLNSLYLAGTTFLDFSETQLYDLGDDTLFSKPLIMGQSAALPANAQDYYIPPIAVKNYSFSSYPFTLRTPGKGQTSSTNGPNAHLPVIDYETVLWKREGQDKKLSDYIGGDKGQVRMLYRENFWGDKLVSLYLDFADEKAANAYYQDYFAVNLAQFNSSGQDKLPKAVRLRLPTDTSSVFAAGNLLHTPRRQQPLPNPPGRKWSDWELLPAAEQVYTEDIQRRYDNLVSPYSLYIDTEKLGKLNAGYTFDFKNDKGKTVARISTEENYVLGTSAPETLRLVIARNNVIVTDNFNGLILAGRDIILRGNVTGIPLKPELSEALCSTLPGYKLGDFLKNNTQLLGANREAWNLNELVVFENWKKN